MKKEGRGVRTKASEGFILYFVSRKEGGGFAPRRIVPFCILNANLLMSKLASSPLLFPSVTLSAFVV